MRSAVIFDIDGTLCDNAVIRHDPFYRKAAECLPTEMVMDFYHRYRQREDVAILIVTSRRECWRRTTERWLAKHGIKYDALYMRRTTDLRNPIIVKDEILHKIQMDYVPILALEDDPRIVDLWRHHTIPTVHVGKALA